MISFTDLCKRKRLVPHRAVRARSDRIGPIRKQNYDFFARYSDNVRPGNDKSLIRDSTLFRRWRRRTERRRRQPDADILERIVEAGTHYVWAQRFVVKTHQVAVFPNIPRRLFVNVWNACTGKIRILYASLTVTATVQGSDNGEGKTWGFPCLRKFPPGEGEPVKSPVASVGGCTYDLGEYPIIPREILAEPVEKSVLGVDGSADVPDARQKCFKAAGCEEEKIAQKWEGQIRVVSGQSQNLTSLFESSEFCTATQSSLEAGELLLCCAIREIGVVYFKILVPTCRRLCSGLTVEQR
ncbi:hypothetical protein B0H13DRAFT_1852426 [Mycena leptocephala]|nr:hypothetical protein B0H13DRAFT_1852426 [Mycena leptocephala]